MFATIFKSAYNQVQGEVVETFDDGRVAISVGGRIVKGWPATKSIDAVNSKPVFAPAEISPAVAV